MVFEEDFFRLTLTVRFQKMCTWKTWIFVLPFSVSYNNVVVTKQIYFPPKILKSCIHISYNIAGAVGGPQYYWRWYRYREGDQILFKWCFYIKSFAGFRKCVAKNLPLRWRRQAIVYAKFMCNVVQNFELSFCDNER